ncbi:hypothetical protein SNE40_003587 [Patella caerulea]|uniref:Uncharacterized protein n=1 Tax=Patella caerulea TaxID=87958 RepID=A0AAN8QFE5_PATCE
MEYLNLKLLVTILLPVCCAKFTEPKQYNTPIFNYKCLQAEVRCIHREAFILEAITQYNLGFLSSYEVKLACTELKTGDVCVKDSGCKKELAPKIRLMKWVCRNRRELFAGVKCWRSDQFREDAPICDKKIQKSCHYHKLVGTCLKSVIGKNKRCTRRQMHFYGGLLEAIDRIKNPDGRCNYVRIF